MESKERGERLTKRERKYRVEQESLEREPRAETRKPRASACAPPAPTRSQADQTAEGTTWCGEIEAEVEGNGRVVHCAGFERTRSSHSAAVVEKGRERK